MSIHKNRSTESRQRAIYTNAYKSISARKTKLAEEAGKEYAPPTEQEIKVECHRRWQQALEREKEPMDVSKFFDV